VTYFHQCHYLADAGVVAERLPNGSRGFYDVFLLRQMAAAFHSFKQLFSTNNCPDDIRWLIKPTGPLIMFCRLGKNMGCLIT
jgi:hypothetical protein